MTLRVFAYNFQASSFLNSWSLEKLPAETRFEAAILLGLAGEERDRPLSLSVSVLGTSRLGSSLVEIVYNVEMNPLRPKSSECCRHYAKV